MKKGIIVVSVLLVVLVLLLQFVWTAPKNVTTHASLKVSAAAANRLLGDTAIWQKIQTTTATPNAVDMKPVMAGMGQVVLRVKHEALDTLSQILLVELGKDSVILNWETPLPASNWFWQHWQQRKNSQHHHQHHLQHHHYPHNRAWLQAGQVGRAGRHLCRPATTTRSTTAAAPLPQQPCMAASRGIRSRPG